MGQTRLISDEFDDQDIKRWQTEYMSVVNEGEKLFHGGLGNENTCVM